MNIVRIYNMRFWMANKIYSFEEFADQPDIEISLNLSQKQDSRLVSEESANLITSSADSYPTNIEMTTLSGKSVLPKSTQNHAFAGSLVPLKISPSTVVDPNKFTSMEQRVFNMAELEWSQLQEKVLMNFPR